MKYLTQCIHSGVIFLIMIMLRFYTASAETKGCLSEKFCFKEDSYCLTDCDCDGRRFCTKNLVCSGDARDCYIVCGIDVGVIGCYEFNQGKQGSLLWRKDVGMLTSGGKKTSYDSVIFSSNTLKKIIAIGIEKKYVFFIDYLTGELVEPSINMDEFITVEEGSDEQNQKLFLRELVFSPNSNKMELAVLCNNRVLRIFVLKKGTWKNTYTKQLDFAIFFSSITYDKNGDNIYFIVSDGNFLFIKISISNKTEIYFMTKDPNLWLKTILFLEKKIIGFDDFEQELLVWDSENTGSANVIKGEIPVSASLYLDVRVVDICAHPFDPNIIYYILNENEVQIRKINDLSVVVSSVKVELGFLIRDRFFISKTASRLFRIHNHAENRQIFSYFDLTQEYAEETYFFLNFTSESKEISSSTFFISINECKFTCDECQKSQFLNPLTLLCERDCPLPLLKAHTNKCEKICPGKTLILMRKGICVEECPLDHYADGEQCVGCEFNSNKCISNSSNYKLIISAKSYQVLNDSFSIGNKQFPFKNLLAAIQYVKGSPFLMNLGLHFPAASIVFELESDQEAQQMVAGLLGNFEFWSGANIIITSLNRESPVLINYAFGKGFSRWIFSSGVIVFKNVNFKFTFMNEANNVSNNQYSFISFFPPANTDSFDHKFLFVFNQVNIIGNGTSKQCCSILIDNFLFKFSLSLRLFNVSFEDFEGFMSIIDLSSNESHNVSFIGEDLIFKSVSPQKCGLSQSFGIVVAKNSLIHIKNVMFEKSEIFLIAIYSNILFLENLVIKGSQKTCFLVMLQRNTLLLRNISFLNNNYFIEEAKCPENNSHSTFAFERLESMYECALNILYSSSIKALEKNIIFMRDISFQNINNNDNNGSNNFYKGVFSLLDFGSDNLVQISRLSLRDLNIKETFQTKGLFNILFLGYSNVLILEYLNFHNIRINTELQSWFLIFNFKSNTFLLEKANFSNISFLVAKSPYLNPNQFLSAKASPEHTYQETTNNQNIFEFFEKNAVSTLILSFYDNALFVNNYTMSNIVCPMSCLLFGIKSLRAGFSNGKCTDIYSSLVNSGVFLWRYCLVAYFNIEFTNSFSPHHYFMIEAENVISLVNFNSRNLSNNQNAPSALLSLGFSNYLLIRSSTIFSFLFYYSGDIFLFHYKNIIKLENSTFERKVSAQGILLNMARENIIWSNNTIITYYESRGGYCLVSAQLNNSLFLSKTIVSSLKSDVAHIFLSGYNKLLISEFKQHSDISEAPLIFANENNALTITSLSLFNFYSGNYLLFIIDSNMLTLEGLIAQNVSNGFIHSSKRNKIFIKNSKIIKSVIDQNSLFALIELNFIFINKTLIEDIMFTTISSIMKLGIQNSAIFYKIAFKSLSSEIPKNLLFQTDTGNSLILNESFILGDFHHIKPNLPFAQKTLLLEERCLIRILGKRNSFYFFKFTLNASLFSEQSSNASFYIIFISSECKNTTIELKETVFGFKGFYGLIEGCAPDTKIILKATIAFKIKLFQHFIRYFFKNFRIEENVENVDLIFHNNTFIDCEKQVTLIDLAFLRIEGITHISFFKNIFRQSLNNSLSFRLFLFSSSTRFIKIHYSTFTFCQAKGSGSLQAPSLQYPGLFHIINVNMNLYKTQIFCVLCSGKHSVLLLQGFSNLSIGKSHFGFNKNERGIGGVVLHEGVGNIELNGNIFQKNQASFGGLIGAHSQIMTFKFTFNVAVGNKAIGIKGPGIPYFYSEFELMMSEGVFGLGSAFYFKHPPKQIVFLKNSVREETLISFWHETYQLRANDSIRKLNRILLKNKIISEKTTKIRKIQFYSIESETFSSRVSIKLNKQEKQMSSECHFIILGIDENNNLQPLSWLNTIIFPIKDLNLNLCLSFKTFIYYDQLSYTCLTNLSLRTFEQESFSFNQLLLVLQIEEFGKTFNETQFINLIKIKEISVTLEQCDAGEYLYRLNGSCSACGRYTYSNKKELSGLALCELCPESGSYNCYGGNIRSPKAGFWQSSLYSSYFLRCPRTESCIGDLFFSETENLDFQEIKNQLRAINERSFSDRFCLKRYKGALCTECEENFGAGPGFSCNDCNVWSLYVTQMILILIRAVLTWITVKKAFELNYELSNSNGEINNRDKMTSGYLIKIMQEHFQHITFLSFLPLELPDSLKKSLYLFFLSSSNDMKNIFSLECFLKLINISDKIKSGFFTIFMQIIFNVISTFVVAFLIKKWRKSIHLSQKRPSLVNFTFISILKTEFKFIIAYIFLTNILGQSEAFIKMFFCYNLDGNNKNSRLISDFSIDCNVGSYNLMKWLISLPMLLFILLILPGWLFIKLYINRKRLHQRSVLKYYAYFYFPYQDSCYFFEICFIAKRILFLLLQIYQDRILVANQGEGTMINLVFYLLGYLIAFKALFFFIDPYKKQAFSVIKNVETISLNVLILTSMGINVWWIEKASFFWPFFLVVGGANIFFIGYLLFHYVKSSVGKFREAFQKIKNFIQKFAKKYKNLTQIQKEEAITDQKAKFIELLKEKDNTIKTLLEQNQLLCALIKELNKKTNPEMFESNWKVSETRVEQKEEKKIVPSLLQEDQEEFFEAQLLELAESEFPSLSNGYVLSRSTSQHSKIIFRPVSGYDFWKNFPEILPLILSQGLSKVHNYLNLCLTIKDLIKWEPFEREALEAKTMCSFQLFIAQSLLDRMASIFTKEKHKYTYSTLVPFLGDSTRTVSFSLEAKSIMVIELEKFPYESAHKLKFICKLILSSFGFTFLESYDGQLEQLEPILSGHDSDFSQDGELSPNLKNRINIMYCQNK